MISEHDVLPQYTATSLIVNLCPVFVLYSHWAEVNEMWQRAGKQGIKTRGLWQVIKNREDLREGWREWEEESRWWAEREMCCWIQNSLPHSSSSSSMCVGTAMINEFWTAGQYSIGAPQTALTMYYAGRRACRRTQHAMVSLIQLGGLMDTVKASGNRRT